LMSCKKTETTVPTPVPIIVEAAPTIISISPTSGPKNTIVTIAGTNFGVNLATLKVYFNGVQATVQTATNTAITAVVPVGASTGAVKVEKTPTVQVTGPVFTYQGYGTVSTLSLTGAASTFNLPIGIVRDAADNLFVCDRDNHRIVKITPAGVTSVFAGGTVGFANGTGTTAQFNEPYAITMDAAGNFYIGDRINNAIRKITPAAVVTTLAGNGTAGSTDGTGSAARFNEPLGVTVDAAGNVYVADYINSAIRKVTPAGVVTTVVGMSSIFGITIDGAGNLYCAQYAQQIVSKYSTTGVYSIIAGQVNTSGTTDGNGAAARFNFPAGITIDGAGNLYVSETFNNRVRKITATGDVTTIAGSTVGFADGIGSAAQFNKAIAVCGDFINKFLYIADLGNNKIRKINLD
jgi:IPT/TIG domain/NHL repeat